jgi:putative transposase
MIESHLLAISFSAGGNKSADLVEGTFQSVNGNLTDIQIFHTDRGNEFKDNTIDKALNAFNIKRSPSHKGCPHDNAVAEATFKIIKTEFIRYQNFSSLYHLQIELADYVSWFNNRRIHSSLGYLTPVRYQINTLEKAV